ncbi:hypothetical protein [Streptomyces sp. NPDC097619]|uniref:hypothetical protein n=1 Tax=Streptomyces sp. NPDC097619 TaxID=3157228 RepID=UPI003316E116
MLQAGGGEEDQPAVVGGGAFGLPQQVPQEPGAFVAAGVADGHPHHVVPPVVVGVAGEHPEVARFHSLLGAEVVEEGGVHEVHLAGDGFAQHSAADQQVGEHLLGGALFAGLRHRGQPAVDQADGQFAGALSPVVADEPVREPLQQQGLFVAGEFHPLDAGDLPLGVPADEQQVEGGVVQLLAGPGQLHAAVPVEGAQQGAFVAGEGGGGPRVGGILAVEGEELRGAELAQGGEGVTDPEGHRGPFALGQGFHRTAQPTRQLPGQPLQFVGAQGGGAAPPGGRGDRLAGQSGPGGAVEGGADQGPGRRSRRL